MRLFREKHRKTAIEDTLLRRLHRSIGSVVKGQRRGSGKSGMVTTCRAGQEILERSAMHITSTVAEARIEVGFPAFGRTIAAGELETLLFDVLPEVAESTFRAKPQLLEELKKAAYLAGVISVLSGRSYRGLDWRHSWQTGPSFQERVEFHRKK